MPIYIAFIIMIFFLFFFYHINNGNVLSAGFLSSAAYSVAIFVAILNYNFWGVRYSFFIVLALFLCISSIGFGEMLSRDIVNKSLQSRNIITTNKIPIEIFPSKLISSSIFLLGIVTCYFSFQEFLRIAHFAGYSGTGYIMEYVRNIYLFTDYSKNYIIVILSYLQTGVAYVITYILINNFIAGKFHHYSMRKILRKNAFYVILIIPFIFLAIITTGRAIFMQYAVYFMLVYLIVFQNTFGLSKLRLTKLFKITLVSMISFLILFFLLGLLTGKTSNNKMLDTLSTYIGSSIPGLDHHLINVSPKKDYMTFYGVKTFFNRLGGNFYISEELYLNDISFPKNGGTNIYTAIWQYYNDFGWIGIIVFNIILGFFVTSLERISRNFSSKIWIILYGYYGYFLIRQIIAESFISYILTTTRIFELISIIAFYFILYKPTINKVKRLEGKINRTIIQEASR